MVYVFGVFLMLVHNCLMINFYIYGPEILFQASVLLNFFVRAWYLVYNFLIGLFLCYSPKINFRPSSVTNSFTYCYEVT